MQFYKYWSVISLSELVNTSRFSLMVSNILSDVIAGIMPGWGQKGIHEASSDLSSNVCVMRELDVEPTLDKDFIAQTIYIISSSIIITAAFCRSWASYLVLVKEFCNCIFWEISGNLCRLLATLTALVSLVQLVENNIKNWKVVNIQNLKLINI